jgi:hypothetical protein
MACQTFQDLDLYPIVKKKKMKSIDAEYQVQVGYWVARNHLQTTKSMRQWFIYLMKIFSVPYNLQEAICGQHT